jgi:radical SAM protein (TIGR01212 family)
VATRPDCLPPQVLDLLAELNRQKPVFVELGLQTIHRNSAAYIRRGYPLLVFDQAMANLTAIGVNKVVHIILGLPGESRDQMAESVRYAVDHGADGLKLQLLHVLRGTDLAADYAAGKCPVLTLPEYLDTLDACLQQVPKEVVIHRLTGDGPKRDLIAPLWSADKKTVLNAIHAHFAPYPLQDGTSSIIIHDSAAEIKG